MPQSFPKVRDHQASSPQIEPLMNDGVSPTGDQFVTLNELEDCYIQEVLDATGQNKAHAARILGIHPTSADAPPQEAAGTMLASSCQQVSYE